MQIEIIGSRRAVGRRWRSDGTIIVMPLIDAEQAYRAATLMANRAGAPGLIIGVHDDKRDGFISIANRVFENSDSPWFGYVAQDAYSGREWLANALNAFDKPETHLVAFNDGKWFGKLAAFGLVRRTWAESNYAGRLFFPAYQRHYADTELTLIAVEQKGLAYAADSVLVEVDWEKDAKAVSDYDRRLFKARASGGFDGKVASGLLQMRFS